MINLQEMFDKRDMKVVIGPPIEFSKDSTVTRFQASVREIVGLSNFGLTRNISDPAITPAYLAIAEYCSLSDKLLHKVWFITDGDSHVWLNRVENPKWPLQHVLTCDAETTIQEAIKEFVKEL